jgi:hypothetical protein
LCRTSGENRAIPVDSRSLALNKRSPGDVGDLVVNVRRATVQRCRQNRGPLAAGAAR